MCKLQPKDREHLGVLEKKKDYKGRAEDYNSKKAQLQLLQKKALDRNPEEFYYSMISSQVQVGSCICSVVWQIFS